MKLYRVTCRGMTSAGGSSTAHGVAYVVARDPDEAYRKLRRHLDKEDLGFSYQRELDKIELLADSTAYPECGCRLFLSRESAETQTEHTKGG